MVRLLDQFEYSPPARLTDPDSWERIRRLAGKLPPLSGGGFEYHLGGRPRRLDFLIRAGSFDFGREALAGAHSQWHVHPSLQEGEHWQKVRSFAKRWSDPTSLIYKTIENSWLEFDMIASAKGVPEPSIFFDLDRRQQLGVKQKIAALQEALSALRSPWPATAYQVLEEQLALAPDNFHLYYVGLMLSRPGSGLRICLAGPDQNQVLPYLQSIGWREHSDPIREILSTYTTATHKLILNLDLHPEPGPGIGLEVFPNNDAAWRHLFTTLLQAGLCTTEEADAILSWPGNQPMPPGSFRQSLSAVMGKKVELVIRRLNHLKFVSTASGGIKAKAYLYFGYY